MSLAHQVNLKEEDVSKSVVQNGGGESYRHSETTRLLCAAAYLDRGFRDEVLKHYVDDEHRAIAPNFGVDMATVVRHCRVAKRKLDGRELWLLVPAIATMLILSLNQSPNPTPSDIGLGVSIVVLAYVIGFLICLWFKRRARAIVTSNFVRGKFDPDRMIGQDYSSVDHVRSGDAGNVVIYSGFTPFVGSGENIGGWSFALDLRKRADGTEETASTVVPISPETVSLDALYARVSRDINALHLDRVTIEDKLYVNGRDIRDDKRFLDHPLARPRNQVPDSLVKAAMLEQPEKQLRHYRCVRVVDWNGEMVLSIFLRLSKLSHNLFVEASYFLLTPVGPRFRGVEAMTPYFNLQRAIKMVATTAVTSPFLMTFAPLILFGRLQQKLHHWSARREERKMILENPTFDYGACFSFRQWASPHEYRRYFQKLDKEMYFKVLEKNILDSMLTFLEENNVDVSELKQRQSMILNTGVIVSGGNLSAENLAVGEGAKVGRKITQIASKAVAAGKQA